MTNVAPGSVSRRRRGDWTAIGGLVDSSGMTAAPPISRYPVPTLAELPEDIRARIVEVQEKAGFIPNVFITLAHRPDEFRAFFAYHDALMLRESGLTKAEREMIVVATSGANDCLYCIVAHGAILRIYAKHPLVADQVGGLAQGLGVLAAQLHLDEQTNRNARRGQRHHRQRLRPREQLPSTAPIEPGTPKLAW